MYVHLFSEGQGAPTQRQPTHDEERRLIEEALNTADLGDETSPEVLDNIKQVYSPSSRSIPCSMSSRSCA